MEKMKPTLTVIMPAYNELKNLRGAFISATGALKIAGISDYEIIIITNTKRDGSHDGTPYVAEQIVKEDSRVRHIHNNSYVGLGFKFRQGIGDARKSFITWVPGDNENIEESVAGIFRHIGEADMITSYTSNTQVRKWKRRFVSRCFTEFCNLLFGLRLKYYNGICIYPTKLLQKVPTKSDNFAYMAEIIIYLVKSGVRYKEVPMEIKPTAISSSFKLKSVFEALGTIALLFWNIHFKRTRIKIGSIN
ncbi:MAG: glycosyltransferase [Candidatus Yanofskybacteria bacterium]|nr:glycosyltransferase [Candidatus Yanofskybacteria bacterium]